MKLFRYIVFAGVLVAIGIYAPARATAAPLAATSSAFDSNLVEKKKDEVPRPRPTPGPRDIAPAPDSNEQKKAETPPRPRPKPGPKDGGEDE